MSARWLPFLTLVVLIVSGCTETAGTKSIAPTRSDVTPATPATATAETGGIDGLVMNDEGLPIPGADVAVVATNFTGKTDATGRFSFSDVTPGAYALAFARIGYETYSKKVEVKAGEVTNVNVTLATIATVDAYVEVLTFNGYIQVGSALLDIFTSETPLPGCDQCIHQFNATEDTDVITLEPLFTPTLPDPRGTLLYTQTYGGGAVQGDTYLNEEWESRHQAVLTKSKWPEGGEWFYQLLYCGQTSLCYEQKYTEYVSLFHNGEPAEGYTALPAE